MSDGKTVAFKLYDPENFDIERTNEEIKALVKCDSEYIGKLYEYGYFDHGSKSYFYSCEEYFDGGTLRDRLKLGSIDKAFVLNLAYILANAIKDIHNYRLVHRDIKPENIMFKKGENNPYLVDFGLVRNLSRESLTPTWVYSGPGTPYYSAPEQLNNQKELIDWRTDQFSLGIVIAECLTGMHPYQQEGQKPINAITSVAEKQNCTDEFTSKMSKLEFDWVIKMTNPWPHQRYLTPDELIDVLKKRR